MHAPPHRHQPVPDRAFTTVELLVSMTVLLLTITGVVAFMYQGTNIYYYDSGRLLVNRDIRKLTTEMTTNAVYANYALIYPDFSTRTDSSGNDAHVADGESGDFLLLVFQSTDATTGKTTVNRLIGYYRDPDATTGIGPVRKFDVTVNPAVVIGSTTNASASPPTYTMPDLLAAYEPTTQAHNNSIVIQFAQGLSNGSLFYDFYDRSIMVKGQIQEQGSLIRDAANTYNFTVSPRG